MLCKLSVLMKAATGEEMDNEDKSAIVLIALSSLCSGDRGR